LLPYVNFLLLGDIKKRLWEQKVNRFKGSVLIRKVRKGFFHAKAQQRQKIILGVDGFRDREYIWMKGMGNGYLHSFNIQLTNAY